VSGWNTKVWCRVRPCRTLAQRILVEFAVATAPTEPGLALTEREREVLHLVDNAIANKQVATTLYISEQTVKNHIKSIMQKLHARNRVELTLHARRLASRHRESPKPVAVGRRPAIRRSFPYTR
jgi:DNA-binding CsgD family transcriptional regulator